MNGVGHPPAASTTLVILLGASEWSSLKMMEPSTAFRNAATSIREYFRSPTFFNLPEDNLLDLFDDDDMVDELDKKMSHFLAERQLTLGQKGKYPRDLVVCFIGHADLIGSEQDLHLLIRCARSENLRVSSWSVKALIETLRGNARHLRTYLILDCCYAAAALRSMPRASGVRIKRFPQDFPSRGFALFCSSSESVESLIMRDGSSTMFSWAMKKALSDGDQNCPQHLHLNDINRLTQIYISQLKEDSPSGEQPSYPELFSLEQQHGDLANVRFFPNVAFQPHLKKRDGANRLEAQRNLKPSAQKQELTTVKEVWREGDIVHIEGKEYMLYSPIETLEGQGGCFIQQQAKAERLTGGHRTVWIKQVRIFQANSLARTQWDILDKERIILEKLQGTPYLPTVIQIRRISPYALLVCSYPPAKTWAEYFGNGEQALDIYQARLLLQGGIELCNALAVLHRAQEPRYHRALGLDNILVHMNMQGKWGRLHVLRDLGLAATPPKPGEGFSPYQAPEQVSLNPSLLLPDQRTDIYRLAAILYHLLTGQLPEKVEDRISSPSILTPVLGRVLSKALKLSPEERYHTVQDFARELRRAIHQARIT